AYAYADGQNWDDTLFDIPAGTAYAEVELYYQTTSKEYVEFLLNENTTDSTGTTLYTQWDLLGKSAPVEMDSGTIALSVSPSPDLDGDGDVDGADLGLFLALWGTSDPTADLNGDGNVDGSDLGLLLAAWGAV
ncbi:MAG: GC-type dockerin domain-anchored protein, partial [Planctomycetota bacterium]